MSGVETNVLPRSTDVMLDRAYDRLDEEDLLEVDDGRLKGADETAVRSNPVMTTVMLKTAGEGRKRPYGSSF